jgi:hypothetical protein
MECLRMLVPPLADLPVSAQDSVHGADQSPVRLALERAMIDLGGWVVA